MSLVEYQVMDGVALLTLNRQESLNAMNSALATDLADAVDEADADLAVRAIVLTGAGRAFCVGADMKAVAAREPIEAVRRVERGFGGLTNHRTRVPLIAAVNGLALGGGAELVLASDIAIASDRASFGFPEPKYGLVAASGGLLRLPRHVPQKIALDMLLTGSPIDAHAALAAGMISRVVDHDTLMSQTIAIAQRIAANGPQAIAATRVVARAVCDAGLDENERIQTLHRKVVAQVLDGDEARRGIRAFLSRIEPDWDEG